MTRRGFNQVKTYPGGSVCGAVIRIPRPLDFTSVHSQKITSLQENKNKQFSIKDWFTKNASNPLQWQFRGFPSCLQELCMKFHWRHLLSKNGQLVWSEMLQALLLQPKMDYQIFINNNLFSRHVSLVLHCPRTINLWSGNSDIAPCNLPPRHGRTYLCVRMVEERSHRVTRYKYCRTDGVKRVGSGHPNPAPY